jgi:hypothetical protein
MVQLEIDKKNEFEFQVEITGDPSKSTPKVEFKIVSPDLTLAFPTKHNNGLYEVSIPELTGILQPGKYVCEICVYLGDRYFVPMTESLELKPKIVPVVSSFKMNSVETEPPEVKVEAVIKKNTEQAIQEASAAVKKISFKRKNIVTK